MGSPFVLKGYEKFWQALLTGGMQTAFYTLTVWWLSTMNTLIPVPDVAVILVAVASVWQTLFTAFSVLVTGNTPTEENTKLPPDDTMVLPEKVEQPKPVIIENTKTITENPVY
jgi:hypothetical protein